MKVQAKPLWIAAGVIALGAALYCMPRTGSTEKATATAAEQSGGAYSFEQELAHAKEHFDTPTNSRIDSLNKVLESASGETKIIVLDSLSSTYDRLKEPALSAHYCEEITTLRSNEQTWLNAAIRYFDAFRAKTADTLAKPVLVEKAIACYTKVLELNPQNLNAKCDLGVCYTETAQPMKGITLLREIVAADPKHENTQYNLGILSVKSKQFDKAIDRFKKVLEINPKRIEMLLYIAESYVQLGDNKNAIQCLEQYKAQSKDAEANKQVGDYIEQLKKS